MITKLSFVVPVYNAARWLENCISSLYRQNLNEKEFEVICVNDGSTDNSLDIMMKWGGAKSNFLIISQKNKGISAARNTGIEYARGQFIRFIDADDYIANNVTSGPLKAAIDNNIDILYTRSKRTSDENVYDSDLLDGSFNCEICDGKEFFTKNNVPNGVWEFFISREFIMDNNLRFIEGRMCEDGMFALSALSCAVRVSMYDVDYYRYVVRENSITTNRSIAHLKKTVDDFSYAILYINGLIDKEVKSQGNSEFAKKLTQRRDAYFFYFQIRCIRAMLKISELKTYLKELKNEGCYPNMGLTPDYGLSHRLLSKLFQSEVLFTLVCFMHRIVFQIGD